VIIIVMILIRKHNLSAIKYFLNVNATQKFLGHCIFICFWPKPNLLYIFCLLVRL